MPCHKLDRIFLSVILAVLYPRPMPRDAKPVANGSFVPLSLMLATFSE